MLHIEWAEYQSFCGKKDRKGYLYSGSHCNILTPAGAHPKQSEWNPLLF